jgi:hypothetical protein
VSKYRAKSSYGHNHYNRDCQGVIRGNIALLQSMRAVDLMGLIFINDDSRRMAKEGGRNAANFWVACFGGDEP